VMTAGASKWYLCRTETSTGVDRLLQLTPYKP